MKKVLGPKCEAFWISPDGRLIPVIDNHIGAVIRDQNIFGLTTDDIEAEYAKENEQIGIEGRARRRIILDLVQRGWIRVRMFPRTGSWTVNVRCLGEVECRNLHGWAAQMLDAGISMHDVVRIDLPDGIMEYDLGDIMKLQI
jgi:hypothetical protein